MQQKKRRTTNGVDSFCPSTSKELVPSTKTMKDWKIPSSTLWPTANWKPESILTKKQRDILQESESFTYHLSHEY